MEPEKKCSIDFHSNLRGPISVETATSPQLLKLQTFPFPRRRHGHSPIVSSLARRFPAPPLPAAAPAMPATSPEPYDSFAWFLFPPHVLLPLQSSFFPLLFCFLLLFLASFIPSFFSRSMLRRCTSFYFLSFLSSLPPFFSPYFVIFPPSLFFPSIIQGIFSFNFMYASVLSTLSSMIPFFLFLIFIFNFLPFFFPSFH